jgi:Group II intron, maturase-specific domain
VAWVDLSHRPRLLQLFSCSAESSSSELARLSCNCVNFRAPIIRIAYYAPKLKKRTALLAKLKEIFQQNVSQPVEGVIEQINPILRGWVNYFAVGDSRECFSFVRDWVEKKIRGHLMRPGSDRASVGRGGVGSGFMGSWASTTITGSVVHGHCRKSSQLHRSHNP